MMVVGFYYIWLAFVIITLKVGMVYLSYLEYQSEYLHNGRSTWVSDLRPEGNMLEFINLI